MSMLAAAQPEDKKRRGTVRRIATFTGRTYIRLNIDEDIAPKDGIFNLRPDVHRNYNAMYSLLLVAATNGYPLFIRTSNSISQAVEAEVAYMLIDFPQQGEG